MVKYVWPKIVFLYVQCKQHICTSVFTCKAQHMYVVVSKRKCDVIGKNVSVCEYEFTE